MMKLLGALAALVFALAAVPSASAAAVDCHLIDGSPAWQEACAKVNSTAGGYYYKTWHLDNYQIECVYSAVLGFSTVLMGEHRYAEIGQFDNQGNEVPLIGTFYEGTPYYYTWTTNIC